MGGKHLIVFTIHGLESGSEEESAETGTKTNYELAGLCVFM